MKIRSHHHCGTESPSCQNGVISNSISTEQGKLLAHLHNKRITHKLTCQILHSNWLAEKNVRMMEMDSFRVQSTIHSSESSQWFHLCSHRQAQLGQHPGIPHSYPICHWTYQLLQEHLSKLENEFSNNYFLRNMILKRIRHNMATEKI